MDESCQGALTIHHLKATLSPLLLLLQHVSPPPPPPPLLLLYILPSLSSPFAHIRHPTFDLFLSSSSKLRLSHSISFSSSPFLCAVSALTQPPLTCLYVQDPVQLGERPLAAVCPSFFSPSAPPAAACSAPLIWRDSLKGQLCVWEGHGAEGKC